MVMIVYIRQIFPGFGKCVNLIALAFRQPSNVQHYATSAAERNRIYSCNYHNIYSNQKFLDE